MTVYSMNEFTADGRLRGTYVYMLLCQMEFGPIHIGVGRAKEPLQRLAKLRSACPVIPRIIALAELANERKASAVERDLHVELNRWHTHLSWFRVDPMQRTEFNAAWKAAVAKHSTPSRPIEFRQYDVETLIEQRKKKQQMHRLNFARRGAVFQDFVKQGS
jgi:hypothetical protein